MQVDVLMAAALIITWILGIWLGYTYATARVQRLWLRARAKGLRLTWEPMGESL
ncbi:MAG: hypothetical protein H0X24_20135 [Ktedonobacterales bacterium]|nr:hypothetical protein [Ktedonobacterales bacterium]